MSQGMPATHTYTSNKQQQQEQKPMLYLCENVCGMNGKGGEKLLRKNLHKTMNSDERSGLLNIELIHHR